MTDTLTDATTHRAVDRVVVATSMAAVWAIVLVDLQWIWGALMIGLALGIVIDLFYDSLGVHASACVFAAFMRPLILQFLEPRGGYPVNANPTMREFGVVWFMRYSGSILLLHLAFYFCVEVFTFVYIGQILLKIIASFIVSFASVMIFMFLFNPKQ